MGFAGKFNMGCGLALSAFLLLASSSVLALGLGEITLNSSLNEPLDAEIVVLKSEGLEDGQLLVSLASPEAFARAGISRDFFYGQIQFSIVRNSADLHIIRMLTEQPVVEPYLNFLVQLQWPAGRVMREYTLLLDLPIYTDEQSPTIQPARLQTQTPVAAVPQSSLLAKTLAPYREPLSGDQHQVISGDTLWNVAKRLRPTDTTILQTMDSLYRHNADAFVEGDANRIKEGSVLRLPSFDEISVEAGNTVAAQIGLKNPAIASADLEPLVEQANGFAENNNPVIVDEQPLMDDGRLELASAYAEAQVDADDDQAFDAALSAAQDNQTAFAEASQVNQLAEELAVANDEVNKAQQENIELRERLALLEAQVATMVTLLEQAEKTAAIPAASAVTSPSKATLKNQSLGQQLAAVPSYFWLVVIAIILILLVLLARKSSQQQTAARSEDFSLAADYEAHEDNPELSVSGQNELHALDDLDLNPEDDLFDKSDADIFDMDEKPDNNEVFDMTAEAVAEADVYLSQGKTAEAIEVLEEARALNAGDSSSRLKLMEILFRENRNNESKDELSALFEEIVTTGDADATAMAAIIVGPEDRADSVALMTENSVAAELEGLDFQSTQVDDLGMGSIDLADLALDELDAGDITFEGDELEDLDLDNLTADDFDIEPAEDEVQSVSASNAEPHTQADNDPSSAVGAPEEAPADSLMDEFSDLDAVSDQSAVDVKLDLATTYLEMGDAEGAREILEELIEDSTEASDDEGQKRARALLESL